MIVQDVKTKLINVLETFTPDNVFLQGTLNPEVQYPQKFCTFFVQTSDRNAFYDDSSRQIDLYFAVIFYSDNATEVATIPQDISAALENEGFIPVGIGNDVISNVQTHTGWAMDFIYSTFLEV